MTVFEFILVVLFTRGVIEIWRNGSIFRDLREFVDYAAGGDRDESDGLTNFLTWNGKLWQLLDCWYCLTPWVGTAGSLFICLRQDYPLWFLTSIFTGLAAASVVILLEAFVPDHAKIDRDPELP